jgi:3-oxoacyl-[acyl-carrier protein] reductase
MNILITGGASGLGEAITLKLASTGDNIFFTFNNSVANARIIERKYANIKGFQCNFHNQSDIDCLLANIKNIDIDILVNNAFTTEISPTHFHKIDISVFLNNFKANIVPCILITQELISNFRKKRFGKIINILSSTVIDNPPIGWSEYTAEKAYLASLSKSWAVENSAFNITSNSVSPSFMQTGLTSFTDERIIEGIKSSNPLKKLLTINEVADTIHFLSQCSQQINGIDIPINSAKHVV